MPAASIKKVSLAGFVEIRFSTKMQFPDNLADLINTRKEENIALRAEGLPELPTRVKLFVVRQEKLPVDDPLANQALLEDWSVSTITEGRMEIKLKFYDPLGISQFDTPDLLNI